MARATPDGYTLLFGADSLVAINPHVFADMGFDPLKDIVPVATAVISQMLLSVDPAVPVKTFKEFLDYAPENRTCESKSPINGLKAIGVMP